jgi:hypothetical protein
MRIFDFKFLILLGLTLVVYFIYRELEYLRNKLEKFENDIKNKFIPKLNQSNDNKKELEKPALLEANNTSAKKISLDINQTIVPNNSPKNKTHEIEKVEYTVMPNRNTLQELINNLNNHEMGIMVCQNEFSDDDIETTSTSVSSKHLAIYSNDNDQFIETQNSLLESALLENKKSEVKFEYSEEKNQSNTKLVNENETKENEVKENHKLSDSETIEASPQSDNKLLPQEAKPLNETIPEKKPESPKKYNKSQLENLKLPELKQIAEELKISITKKGKQKNKPELIENIIQHFRK